MEQQAFSSAAMEPIEAAFRGLLVGISPDQECLEECADVIDSGGPGGLNLLHAAVLAGIPGACKAIVESGAAFGSQVGFAEVTACSACCDKSPAKIVHKGWAMPRRSKFRNHADTSQKRKVKPPHAASVTQKCRRRRSLPWRWL